MVRWYIVHCEANNVPTAHGVPLTFSFNPENAQCARLKSWYIVHGNVPNLLEQCTKSLSSSQRLSTGIRNLCNTDARKVGTLVHCKPPRAKVGTLYIAQCTNFRNVPTGFGTWQCTMYRINIPERVCPARASTWYYNYARFLPEGVRVWSTPTKRAPTLPAFDEVSTLPSGPRASPMQAHVP